MGFLGHKLPNRGSTEKSGHLGAQRTFRLQGRAPRRARTKKASHRGGRLVARTRYSNNSRSRTSLRVARLYPRHWLISSLWKKICTNGGSGPNPNPLFELKPGVAGFGKFFFPGRESTSAISWLAAFRWFRSTAPWGLSAFPPNPPKTADSGRSCGCGNSGACDSRGRFLPSSEATIPHS